MSMPGRKYLQGSSTYRYSINGQEKSDELNENLTSAKYWEYDSRIGRRWNVDPKLNISLSPYATFRNDPIFITDILGDTTYNTPGGGQQYTSDPKAQTYDGSVQQVGDNKNLKIQPAKGTLKSFTVNNDGLPNGSGRFVAQFDKTTGKFTGYGLANNPGYTYDKFISDFKDGLLDNLNHQGDIRWDPNISYEEARKNFINNNLALALPTVLIRPLTIATNTAKILKPLGLGSTGRTAATNLTEQLAMEEIMSNPEAGKTLIQTMKDASGRWSGWSKMSNKTAHGVEIHYNALWKNGTITAIDDFKFIGGN